MAACDSLPPMRTLALGVLAAAVASAASPNVVLFYVDDLGWKDLAVQGSEVFETPNADRLAAEGIRFTQAYAPAPVCSPSRAALMTGKTPARVGFTGHITAIARHRHPEHGRIIPPDDYMNLPAQETTLAEALAPAGYVSASVGKWHLGFPGSWPRDHGFDVNIAGQTHGSPPSHFFPYEDPKKDWNPSIETLHGGQPGEYLTDRLTDEAIGFIRENRDRPFFLYLTHYAVHTPLEAPAALVEKYRKKLGPDSKVDPVYAAMVESMDQSLGRVLRALKDLGLEERTAVIFTSDNGGLGTVTDNQPLREGKGFLYEGGIRVPLIVRWPGVVEAGRTSEEPVVGTDLYPTIVEMAGSEARGGDVVDGRSLLPLLRGEVNKLDRDLYWYYPHYSPQAQQPGAALRAGRWKLIEHYDPPRVELFDLAEDPGEETDLAAQLPDTRGRLLARLRALIADAGTKMHSMNPAYRPR